MLNSLVHILSISISDLDTKRNYGEDTSSFQLYKMIGRSVIHISEVLEPNKCIVY